MESNKRDLFSQVKDTTGKISIGSDIGISNKKSKSSIVAREDGNIYLSAGEYVQIKGDKDSGNIIESSLSSVTNTVMKEINVTDTVVNKHKFNSQLVELSDFRNVNGNIIGDMNINGTVLVKTWEPTLNKWVLIRRSIHTPMFSNRLNIASTPEQMEVDIKIEDDIKKYYIKREGK